jgi:hypothetical protein
MRTGGRPLVSAMTTSRLKRFGYPDVKMKEYRIAHPVADIMQI